MLKKVQRIRWLILFLLAFGLHQAGNYMFSADPTLGWVQTLTFLAIALITILFIRNESSRFREYGLLIPRRAGRLFALAAFFAVLFVFVVLFLPGAVSGFEALPGSSIGLDMLLTAGSILLASTATEMVFRGYIQTKLENAYGFNTALVLVSTMFALFMYPVTNFLAGDLTGFLLVFLPLLSESIFLCFFFKETKTLLCPVVFASTVTLLRTFTPLEAIAVDYAVPFMIVTYIVLVPVMQSFVGEVHQQEARADVAPVLDSEKDEEI